MAERQTRRLPCTVSSRFVSYFACVFARFRTALLSRDGSCSARRAASHRGRAGPGQSLPGRLYVTFAFRGSSAGSKWQLDCPLRQRSRAGEEGARVDDAHPPKHRSRSRPPAALRLLAQPVACWWPSALLFPLDREPHPFAARHHQRARRSALPSSSEFGPPASRTGSLASPTHASRPRSSAEP